MWTYTYDAANRLVHVEDGTGSISADYYYDPFDRRLWKEVGENRTYFFYADEGLIGEYDASGNEIKTYGYRPDSTWTTDPLFMKQGTDYYFYQNDHLGTSQKLVAMNGAIVWSVQYSLFGKAEVQVETVINNLRFPGQYVDVETGLHYNFQRYYNPKIGRYIQSDPVGFAGGDVNLFKYAVDNPINLIDPYGFKTDAEEPEVKEWYKRPIIWLGNKLPSSYNDWVVNHTPGKLTPKKFWEFWSESKRQKWFRKFRNKFGKEIDLAALRSCVPRELLAGVIANEQIDYGWGEELREDWLGIGSSVGPS